MSAALVNDRSIVRCAKGELDQLSYFHLELEGHHVILAEGAPAKSLLADRMVPFAPDLVRRQKVQIYLEAQERNFTLGR